MGVCVVVFVYLSGYLSVCLFERKNGEKKQNKGGMTGYTCRMNVFQQCFVITVPYHTCANGTIPGVALTTSTSKRTISVGAIC